MIERLISLKSYGSKFAKGGDFATFIQTNVEFRNLLETLSRRFLKRAVNGCSNCYMDAYFELINLNIEKVMKQTETQFQLVAGALLGENDLDNLMTNRNTTDELAIYHLLKEPKCIKFFSKVPENLDEILKKASKAKKEAKAKKETEVKKSEILIPVEAVAVETKE